MDFNRFFAEYGIQPMTLEEELNQPENVAQTRQNKVSIIKACNHAIRVLEMIKFRAKYAPELDDDHHAKLVKEMRDKVHKAEDAIEDAYTVGFLGGKEDD